MAQDDTRVVLVDGETETLMNESALLLAILMILHRLHPLILPVALHYQAILDNRELEPAGGPKPTIDLRLNVARVETPIIVDNWAS